MKHADAGAQAEEFLLMARPKVPVGAEKPALGKPDAPTELVRQLVSVPASDQVPRVAM